MRRPRSRRRRPFVVPDLFLLTAHPLHLLRDIALRPTSIDVGVHPRVVVRVISRLRLAIDDRLGRSYFRCHRRLLVCSVGVSVGFVRQRPGGRGRRTLTPNRRTDCRGGFPTLLPAERMGCRQMCVPILAASSLFHIPLPRELLDLLPFGRTCG